MVQNRYEIGTKSVVQKILFSRWLFGENKSPTIAIVGRGVKKLRFLQNSQIDNVPGTLSFKKISKFFFAHQRLTTLSPKVCSKPANFV